jgi:hypothetical protein
MPATPFIGISVLIHILIIIFHKVFRIKEREPRSILLVSRGQYVFSVFIVLAMFALMLSTAVGLLAASITERHSTVYLIENTAVWISTQIADADLVANVTEAYQPQAGVVAGVLILFIIAAFSVSYLRFPRATLTASQGGYSLVQVSLFISGVIAVMVGVTYSVLYLLIATSQ